MLITLPLHNSKRKTGPGNYLYIREPVDETSTIIRRSSKGRRHPRRCYIPFVGFRFEPTLQHMTPLMRGRREGKVVVLFPRKPLPVPRNGRVPLSSFCACVFVLTPFRFSFPLAALHSDWQTTPPSGVCHCLCDASNKSGGTDPAALEGILGSCGAFAVIGLVVGRRLTESRWRCVRRRVPCWLRALRCLLLFLNK